MAGAIRLNGPDRSYYYAMGGAIMASNLCYTVPESGDAVPTCGIQFGSKFFVLMGDARPFYLYPSADNQKLIGCGSGIKPPTTAPTLAQGATLATNLVFNSQFPTAYFSYAYYSRARVIYSQMSPVASIVLTDPAHQIVVSGFENPRDNSVGAAVDTIVIFCQLALNNGLMNTGATMWIDCSDGVFTSKSFVFDISGATLDLGLNGSDADPYFTIPPAFKYATKSGNRLWYGGARSKVAFNGATVTVTENQTFRLTTPVAKITISGGTFNDSLYSMLLVVNGKVIGSVFDVNPDGSTPTVLYVDQDVPANISSTDDFYFLGLNDRLFAGSFIGEGNLTLNSTPISFTECVSLLPGVVQILTPALDGAKNIIGVQNSRGVIYALFPDCAQPLLGGLEENIPLPALQENFGKTGPIADRSYAIDPQGQILFFGQEGLIALNTAQMVNIAAQVECLTMFKGGIWIALADLPTMVQAYCRAAEGLVMGNFTINGVDNWWGLFSYQPQPGFWLFSGQEITTNIFEYTGSDGQGVIVAGDSYRGRFKRLLDPAAHFLDVQLASDTPAPYDTNYLPGYGAQEDFAFYAKSMLEFPGILVPGSTVTLSINQVWTNFPQRDLDLVPAGNKASKDVDINALAFQRVPLSPGQARYYTVGISHLSNSGLSVDGTMPVQIPHYTVKAQKEQK